MKGAKTTEWEKSHQQTVSGKPNIHLQNKEVRSLLYTMYKNQIKVERPNIRSKTIKLLQEQEKKRQDIVFSC